MTGTAVPRPRVSPGDAAPQRMAPQDVAIVRAHLVLRDEVLEDADIVVRDGRIAAFGSHGAVASDADLVIDAHHTMYVLPGLVDTHNDGLEVEVNPRPGVNFPGDFALRNYERRSLAGGVTTSFHAITFATVARNERTLEDAVARCSAIRRGSASAAIDHQVLHRCDVWSPEGLEPLLESMRSFPAQAMSLNDHTPGQGQFRNLDALKRNMRGRRAHDPSFDADADIQARIAARAADTETVPAVLNRVRRERDRRRFVLASHDDDSPEKVDEMVQLGASIAEFPVTIEAARRAREQGMWITVGAPNIVRGGSTSGNQDATELVAAGLADIICADYHAPSMLFAALKLVGAGLATLPEAVAKVTANPAAAFGLDDRGRIEVGLSADLALVELHGTVPLVQAVLRRGVPVYATVPVRAAIAVG